MSETEICDWCSTRFPADAALFDMQEDPDTGAGTVIVACPPNTCLPSADAFMTYREPSTNRHANSPSVETLRRVGDDSQADQLNPNVTPTASPGASYTDTQCQASGCPATRRHGRRPPIWQPVGIFRLRCGRNRRSASSL